MTAILADVAAAGPADAAESDSTSSTQRERALLAALLVATGLLYLWGLGASGYANEFYAAAVQAGTKSWKAFFFGSFDSSNFITVDKPPASLWLMELSGRIFGFNSWSMLVPQAIEGVLTVWLLYATVRRWFGSYAGLIAGALLAITPVAVLMFRFNNPDALMTLLIVAAAYCATRAIEVASPRWLMLSGAAIGFSFLVKGLQPFTVLPALAIAYLVAAPTTLRRRLLQLLAAAAALVMAAGWWVLVVALVPASARPYIGGSGDNTALGLAFGYNGLGRITGNESTSGDGGGGPGGGGGAGGFSGKTGLGRLFNDTMGSQISWLIPAALIAIVALGVVTRRATRSDRTRAAVIMWGGWLLVTGVVLSYASGIIHEYYTIELAPAISALVAIGTVTLWQHRAEPMARAALAAGVGVTALWSYELLDRSPDWHPELRYAVLLVGIGAAIAIVLPTSRIRRAALVAGTAAAVAVAGGSTAYALDTASTPHTGSIPTAGPAVTTGGGIGPGGGFRPGNGPRNGSPPQGMFPGGVNAPGGLGDGGFPGASAQTGTQLPAGTQGDGGPAGGSSASVDSELVALLKATDTKWAAATIGSQQAAPLELASGKAVIAIGGFSGSDDAPTLAQFEKLVAAGKVRYFIEGGRTGGPGGGGSGSEIATWVAAHFTATTVGNTTVYDLTKGTS
ncbi:MAG TPA: glycosyltransferase family 39 protein [Jatrophihabitantaceae bacterium]|nr:glycosyltransferase family 39 protein [Jatrophihabitantaceae bacterium]